MNEQRNLNEQQEALISARQAHVERQLPSLRRFDNYLWSGQKATPRHEDVIVAWLYAWYESLLGEGDKPKPILHLHGDNNTGKSHLAIGIARFIGLNFHAFNHKGYICDVRRVRWVSYCKALLKNGGDVTDIDEDVGVLIIDDIDSFRPVPKSLSTYAIEEAVNVLKGRAEDAVLPIIITGNWAPSQLLKFFMTNSLGDSSSATEQAAKTLWSVIERNTFAQMRFAYHRGVRNTIKLRKKAENENDMSVFLDKFPGARF